MHHYIIAPTLEMRKQPDGKAEVVSQGLFSEPVRILEEFGEWVHIETLVDHYTGWIRREGFCSRKSLFPENELPLVTTVRLATHLYDREDTIYGPIMTLPFESRLAALDLKGSDSRWLRVELPDSRRGYVQRGDIMVNPGQLTPQEVCAFSQNFLGLPYTWGGRSSFGYDCSGFVQMLYRQMGISLPRDSKDQFNFSKLVDVPVTELKPSDLIFYGYAQDQIRHVGMSLGDGRFIHTSAVTENKPYLRISHINDPAWNGSGYYPFLAGKALSKSKC